MKSRNSHREIALCGAALSVLVITLAGVSPALAAEAAADAADAGEVSELVVTAPIRESLEKSLAIQKEADNVVNVIAADTIGRFPDATAAGALARLPGIGVQRDQGQERYIQIRGAPTRWTTVALDGINVLGSEDRIFRFDSVPAAQISEVVLNKTLLPSMPAESLAGRVNIRTYSPMDNPGFHGSFDVGGGFVDMGDGPVEQYSGRLSWANDTWGVSLIGSHYSFEQHTDNSEPRFDALGITQLRITKYIITRQTESYSGRVEYRPDDNNRFSLTHLKTEFNDFEERNQYRFQYSNAFSGTRNFQTADLVGVPVDSQFEFGTFSNGVKLTVLHGEHEINAWKANWDLAYTETEFNGDIPLITRQTSTALGAPGATNAALLPSLHLDVNALPGGIPHSTLYDTVSVGGVLTRGPQRTALNQLFFPEEFATESSYRQETQAVTAKGDITRDWESFGAEATFSAGFQYDDRSQEGANVALVRPDGTVVTANRNGFNLRNVANTLGLPWNANAFVTANPWDTNFDFGYTVSYMHNKAMRQQLDVLMAAARAANKAGTGNFAVYDFDPRSANTVDETVASAYAMNRWKWDRHTLIAGLRLERTELETQGRAALGGTLVPLSFSSEETQYFPSLHYTFDYSDDLKLRAAFITGQARPSMSDLSATVSISDSAQTISGGNPFAAPETAYGFDGSAEWYFAPASLLAVSAYYRNVKDVLFDASKIVGDDSYDFGGVDRSAYTLTTTLNGGEGNLSGIEFVYYQPWTFLPGWTSGFGFQGSASFTKGDFETPDGSTVKFPGTSDRILGATLFYEKYGLSTRLTYQYRTDWLDEVFPSGSAANANLYWDETTRLDLSIRYEINPYVSLFIDANNLTDERGVRYQGQEHRPYEVEGFGRKYLFGVRASF
ncbi:TonB-dependent receptor [Phenylobacterium ferrooxidans]|uniref:TonB-dependent receptor n=1 Tax=Phenylobacterium ferrooxidans TaxID=2982689 RepID=A0ABW6CIG5_9CAUL